MFISIYFIHMYTQMLWGVFFLLFFCVAVFLIIKKLYIFFNWLVWSACIFHSRMLVIDGY